MAALNLYTDACVFGERLPKHYRNKRRRVGPAFVAWAAWHDCDHPQRPTFAGQAFVGECGTQRAEFQAAQHGLSGALGYVRNQAPSRRPEKVVAFIDNQTVVQLMQGAWTPNELQRFYDHTVALCRELADHGVPVIWEQVSERHKIHKVAHTMSKQARHQILRPEWRPADDPPAAAAA